MQKGPELLTQEHHQLLKTSFRVEAPTLDSRWPPASHALLTKAVWLVVVLLYLSNVATAADIPPRSPSDKLGQAGHAIELFAPNAGKFQTEEGSILILEEGVSILQGDQQLTCNEAVIWFDEAEARRTGLAALDLFARGGVRLIERARTVETRESRYLRMESSVSLVQRVTPLRPPEETPRGELWQSALRIRRGAFPSEPGKALPKKEPTRTSVPAIILHADDRVLMKQTEDFSVWTLRGNATGVFGEHRIEADLIRVWTSRPQVPPAREPPPVERAYAEGAVMYRTGEATLTADALYLDFSTNKGIAIGARFRTREPESGIPVVFFAPELRQVDKRDFEAAPAYFTTCEFGVPHYKLKSTRASLVEGRRPAEKDEDERKDTSLVLSAWHNILYLDIVPIFYWPYAAKDVKKEGFVISSLRSGHSSEFGTHVLTEWDLYQLGLYRNDWSELTLELDYYERLGLGTGLDLEYELENGFGLLDTYYIKDRQEFDEEDRPIRKDDRGRALWRHRQYLPWDVRLDAEVSWLSDVNFLETYVEDEFEEGKDQETILYLRRLDGRAAYTLLVQDRINSFHNVVERLPEIGLDIIGASFLNGAVAWTSRNSLVRLQQNFSELTAPPDPHHVVRADSFNEFSLPLEIGFVQADPFVGLQGSAFSDTAGGDDSRYRSAEWYGARAAADFYQEFNWHNGLLDVNRVRHIVTPRVEYRRTFHLTDGPEKFIQHDITDPADLTTDPDEIDSLDREHVLSFGLDNRLQTKRRSGSVVKSVDFLILDLDYNLRPGSRGANRGVSDLVEADFEWKISNNLRLKSIGNEYNVTDHRWEVAHGALSATFLPPWEFTYEHQYVDVPRERGPDESISALRAAYGPKRSRWKIELETRYDFAARKTSPDRKNPKQLGSRLAFSRKLHRWLVVFAIELKEGREEDTIVTLMIQPEGLSAARISL